LAVCITNVVGVVAKCIELVEGTLTEEAVRLVGVYLVDLNTGSAQSWNDDAGGVEGRIVSATRVS